MDTENLLTVDVQDHPSGVPVVSVHGDVDLATAPAFQEAIDRQVTTGQDFVVDMDGVKFLSSAGLAVLVDTSTRMTAKNLRWALVAGHTAVTRPLEITGLTPVLPVFTSVLAALEALSGG